MKGIPLSSSLLLFMARYEKRELSHFPHQPLLARRGDPSGRNLRRLILVIIFAVRRSGFLLYAVGSVTLSREDERGHISLVLGSRNACTWGLAPIFANTGHGTSSKYKKRLAIS